MRSRSAQSQASANSGAKSVTGTSSEILAVRTGAGPRRFVQITNCDASASVYIAYGYTASSTDFNIKLGPGAVIALDGTVPNEAINAISSSGTISVRVYEGV